jgi:hypothetical protein
MRARRAFVLVLGLAACDRLTLPRVPQVEQASEAVQDRGDRYRAHRACTNAASSVDGLIRCMQDAGWAFVTRGPGYPEADCWQARDREELERVIAICFTRAVPDGASSTP